MSAAPDGTVIPLGALRADAVHGPSHVDPPPWSVSEALAAGAVAALVSGLPSTLHALRTGADPLQASLAAGSLLLPAETRSRRLLAAAALVHGTVSLGWALVLAATLPARRTTAAGGLAGAAIAAVDLGLVGRRFPPVRRLPVLPQLVDHVCYGVVVGSVLARRRRRRDRDVVAVRSLTAGPDQVFQFLAHLPNHWLLNDRFVELGGLERDDADRAVGGRVRLKGPLGITREAETRVLSARPPVDGAPGRLAGRADIGTTTGRVGWEIAPREGGGSLVTLAATADQLSPLDRLLLGCGRWWLQRTFDQALANLDRILDPRVRPLAPRQVDGAPREWKRKLSTAVARRVVNPVVRTALEWGIAPPGYALVETTGRTSGLPRRTPVGNGLDGNTFWIVAEHGRKAGYVRNIEADPRVRVKTGRRWRPGTAHLLPGDDPRQRQQMIGRRFNAAVVRLMGTDLLTVRIDLDGPAIGQHEAR